MGRKEKNRVPSRDECIELMKRCGMLEHIVAHSMMVAAVALFLSEELNKKGENIDKDVVQAASLLHDLAKTQCLGTRKDHARKGFELLKRLGYRRVAEVVARHIVLDEKRTGRGVSEEEIVNYADKRVQHDKVVSLKERFEDLRARYGGGDVEMEAMKKLEDETYEIECKIFSILGMDPDVLKGVHPSVQPGYKDSGDKSL